MRAIPTYILIEIIKVFLAALIALSLLLSVSFSLREGLREGLPVGAILQATYFMLPETLGITLPVATLLAVCTVYARMAGGNELVAVKSLGIHPMQCVWPALVFGFALSLVTVWFYDLAAVWGRPNLRKMVAESMDEIIYGVLRISRSYSSRDLSISVERVEGERLIRPTIIFRPRNGGAQVVVRCREAVLRVDRAAGELEMSFWDSEFEPGRGTRLDMPGKKVFRIPLPLPGHPIHRDWLAMAEIPRYVADLQRQESGVRAEMASLSGYQPGQLKQRQTVIEDLLRQIHRLRTEPYRRWANGFTCLFFTLIGVSVAVQFRFESQVAVFFACFAPILVIYYPLLMLQEKLTISGILPPVFFWIGNLVLLLPSAWLMRRFIQR